MTADLDGLWDWMVEAARAADLSVLGAPSWVPPVEESLVRAARSTHLHRLRPFMSHTSLCFVDGPFPWDPGGRPDVKVLPGAVSFDSSGPDGAAVFWVWSGAPTGRAPGPVLVGSTPSATRAAKALACLLAP
ncbi:hypothetical protein AB0J38_22990 [Streptomyces sp. NPDC050095]|uniref:hypothetical protein n=1 Tax=unclassified Streptomyces TaxID=2593676 RepID=UPI003424A073